MIRVNPARALGRGLALSQRLARPLGLPDSETPWVFVLDPTGAVVESVHGPIDSVAFARVQSALRRAGRRE